MVPSIRVPTISTRVYVVSFPTRLPGNQGTRSRTRSARFTRSFARSGKNRVRSCSREQHSLFDHSSRIKELKDRLSLPKETPSSSSQSCNATQFLRSFEDDVRIESFGCKLLRSEFSMEGCVTVLHSTRYAYRERERERDA